jgi:hypothetical protein
MQFIQTINVQNAMTENTKKIYKIGMAAYLLADYLSDYQLRQALRGIDFGKYLERLREISPELKLVSGVMLAVSKIEQETSKYCKRVEQDAKASAIEEYKTSPIKELEGNDFVKNEVQTIQRQFAISSDILDNWLDVMHQVPVEKYSELNDLIETAVEQVKGKRKTDIDLLLEWIASYPEGYTMSLQTVRNKAIHIKNRTT